MNQSTIDATGKPLHPRGLSRVMAYAPRRVFARATVTHGVFEENMQAFGRTIEFVAQTRRFIEPDVYFEFLDCEHSHEHPARGGILMTFDDGLVSSYEFIANELTPRGVRVIVFVPTGVLTMTPDEQHAFALRTRFPGLARLREEQYLTIGPKEVGTLVHQGHVVMPHSHTHARLSALTTSDQLYNEIVRPQHIIQGLITRPADVFAFPYGGRTALTSMAYSWIERTYTYCFTAIGGRTTPRSNRLLLRRDNMDQTFDVARIAALLDGIHDPINQLKAWSLRLRVGGFARRHHV